MAIRVAKYSNKKNDLYTTNEEIEKLIQEAKRYTDSETGKYDYYSDVDVADFPLFTHRYTDNSADLVKSWRDIYYPRNKLYSIKVKNLPKRLQEKLLKLKVSDVGTNTRSDISPETTLIYDSTGRNLSYTELKYIQQNFPDYAKDYVSIEDKDAVSDFIDQYDPRDVLYENVQKANKQRYLTSYERYFNQLPQKGNEQLISTPRAVPSLEALNANVVESGSDKDNFFINVGTSENAPLLTGTHIGVPGGTGLIAPLALAGVKINRAAPDFPDSPFDYPIFNDYQNYEFEPIELLPIETTTVNALPMNWGFNLNYRDYDWDDDDEQKQKQYIIQQYPDYMKYLMPYMFSDLREKPFKKEDGKEVKIKIMALGGDTLKPKRKLLDIATMFALPDLYLDEIEDIDFVKELFEPLGIRHNSIGNVPPEEAHKYTIKRFDDGGALVVDNGNGLIDNLNWDTYAQLKFSEYEDYQIVPDLTEEELNVFDDGGLAIEELALLRAAKATAPKANYHLAIDFVYSPVSAMKMAYDKGVSNCTLTASQFYNPKKPIARAKTITTTPHAAGFYEVGENYAVPGSMVIASLPNGNDYDKNSYHTMILNGYADKNYQFPFKGKVYNVKKGDPLVNYSRGKREPENYIKNIPLSVYLDNSDGKTNVRYYRPYNEGLRAKLLPEIIVTPNGNSIAGGGASSTWANGGKINKFGPGGFTYIPNNQLNLVVRPFEFEGIRYGWLPNGGIGEDVYSEHNDRNGVYVRWDNDANKWAKTTVPRDLGNIKNYFAGRHNELSTYNDNAQAASAYDANSELNKTNIANQLYWDPVNKQIRDKQLSERLSSYTAGNFLSTIIPAHLADPMNYIGAAGEYFRGNDNFFLNALSGNNKGMFSLSDNLSNWAEEHPYLSAGTNLLGGAALGFGMLGATKFIPKVGGVLKAAYNYSKPYVLHPTWKTYYHGRLEPIDFNNINLGTSRNLGLHVGDKRIAQLFAGKNGVVYKIRAPRASAETIDIKANNYNLLSTKYPFNKTYGFRDGYKGDLKFNMLEEAGAKPTVIETPEGNLLYIENSVSLNLRERFPNVTKNPKLNTKVNKLIERAEQAEKNGTMTRDLARLLNLEATEILSDGGYDVVKYANPEPGEMPVGQTKPYYSYFINNSNKMEIMPTWKLAINMHK